MLEGFSVDLVRDAEVDVALPQRLKVLRVEVRAWFQPLCKLLAGEGGWKLHHFSLRSCS